MQTRHTACGSWDADEWIAVAATALCFRSNVLAAAYWLGSLSVEQLLAAGVYPTELARRLFGRSQLDHEVGRVRACLHTVGYGPSAISRHSLITSLAILFVLVGRAELEALTMEVMQHAYGTAPAGSGHRQMSLPRGACASRHGTHSAWDPAARSHADCDDRHRSGVGRVVHTLAGDDDSRASDGGVHLLRGPQGGSVAGSSLPERAQSR